MKYCKTILAMTMYKSIDNYFHMRNHFRKLRHVKSVVDTNLPNTVSGIAGAKEKTKKKSISKKESMHNILQFSLRITEDIIKNDMYGNQDMMAVLRAHYQDNKGTLDEDKMLMAIAELCKELNIPFDVRGFEDNMDFYQSPRTPETLAEINCICPPKNMVYTDVCQCSVPRPPPIACPLHDDIEDGEMLRKLIPDEISRREEESQREGASLRERASLREGESQGEGESQRAGRLSDEVRSKEGENQIDGEMQREEEWQCEEERQRESETQREIERHRVSERRSEGESQGEGERQGAIEYQKDADSRSDVERHTLDDEKWLADKDERRSEMMEEKDKGLEMIAEEKFSQQTSLNDEDNDSINHNGKSSSYVERNDNSSRQVAGSDNKNDYYPILMDLMEQEQSHEKPVKMLKKKRVCSCGSDSCNPSDCDVSVVNEEEVIVDEEIVDDEDIDFTNIDIDDQEPSDEEEESEAEEAPVASTKDEACVCDEKEKDNFLSYLDYFEKHMEHTKHLRALDFCHQSAAIEPLKIKTHDLSVQTSADHIYKPVKQSCTCDTPQPSANYQKLQFPKEPQFKTQIPSTSNDDFVVISGPIFIPKDLAKSGKGIRSLFQTPTSTPSTPVSRLISPRSCSKCTACQYSTQNLDHLNPPTRQEVYPRKPETCPKNFCQPNFFQSNEYDLTPQRDTFHSEEKRNICCDYLRDNATRLLGNTYNKLMMPKEECHLSLYYPTTATQVSSMDLLNYISIQKAAEPDRSRDDSFSYSAPPDKASKSIASNGEDLPVAEFNEKLGIIDAGEINTDNFEDELSDKSSSNTSAEGALDDSEPLVRDRAVSVSINADVDVISGTESKKQSGYANRIHVRK